MCHYGLKSQAKGRYISLTFINGFLRQWREEEIWPQLNDINEISDVRR